jgi:molybdopterin molybdotransferase
MAQLTDDCFAFSGPLLPIADMERLIAERVQPVAETERVALAAARGRVLAADMIAPLDLPPFDNSAVDGYAVRHRDLDAKMKTKLAISGRLPAGSGAAMSVGEGEAVRIFTGAPMPPGADTVFMQEDVRTEGDNVIVPTGLKLGANRRLSGEDVRKGSVVLPAGRRLAAQDVALAAAIGLRCSRPATRSSSPAARGPPPRSTTPTVTCSMACSTGSAPRSPTSAFSRTIRQRWKAPSQWPPATMIWC